MSGRKNRLEPYHSIQAGNMSGTLTSSVTTISGLDNVAIQLSWTGTPTGTFQVQGSLDYSAPNLAYGGPVLNAGVWTPLAFSTPPVASGAAGSIFLDLNQLSFPYIRVVYTPTSGTGSLDMWISGKAV